MTSSNLYNKLSEDEQLITEDSSDQWDERFEEVTCALHYSHKFDDSNDVSTTYLGSYMAKDEPRTFPVDNHIPFDGRGLSKAYLSNGTPMILFFDSGASRSYLSKNSMNLILCCMTCHQYMRIRRRYGSEKGKNDEKQTDPYQKPDPLADDDPRRYQSDEEIMYEKIDLSNSAFSSITFLF